MGGRNVILRVICWIWNQHSMNTCGAPCSNSARLKRRLNLYRGKQPHSHKPHMTTFTSHFKTVHILHELDVIFTSLTSSCFQTAPSPQHWDYHCKGMLWKSKYVLETTRTQIPHEYVPKPWLKKHNPCPKKMQFYFSGFGKGSNECLCVVALLWAKWQGGGAGWQQTVW